MVSEPQLPVRRMTTSARQTHSRAPQNPNSRSPGRLAAADAKRPGSSTMTGAEFLVKALEAHGVTHVFGIPGAKVDSVFKPCWIRPSSWCSAAMSRTRPSWPKPSGG